MAFGAEIRKARIARGMSLREVAERVSKDPEPGRPAEHISLQYLNDIEHGRRNPPSEHVIGQLARALDLSKDYLIYLAGSLPKDIREKKLESSEVDALFTAFRKDARKKS